MQDIIDKSWQFQNLTIKKANAHYYAAEIYGKRNLRLGVPVTIASSVVATSIFATVSKIGDAVFWVSIATGVLSVCAAILSGLQTFLRYSEIAGNHRRAAVAYEGLRRRLDLFRLQFEKTENRSDALTALSEIAGKIDVVADAAPTLPDKIYDTVKWRPANHMEYSTPPDMQPPLWKPKSK